MLSDLRADADNEHQYTLWLGGVLRSTHWLVYNSHTDRFGESTDWEEYYWYTEEEYLRTYANMWWSRDH